MTQESDGNVHILGFPILRSKIHASIWNATIVVMICNFIMLGIISFNWIVHPPMRVVAVSPDLRYVVLPYIHKPYLSETGVETWVENVMLSSVSLSYDNYQSRLSELKDSFSPEAYASYTDALTHSKLIKTLVKYRYITTAIPVGHPGISNHGIYNQHRMWVIQFPAVINFIGASGLQHHKEHIVFSVTVEQVPLSVNPRGLVIVKATSTRV